MSSSLRNYGQQMQASQSIRFLASAVRWGWTLVLFLLLTACQAPKSVDSGDQGKVVGIKDGDTFEILINGRSEVVRLAHIDCPERGQPFGKAAKQLASDLCYDKHVIIEEEARPDRYGRLIATVSLPNGVTVNQELVRAGLAWHYTKYSSDTTYAVLEKQARMGRLGLWADSVAVAPWTWRKK
jgi:endonuclease YncB( thermonuclease family)